MWMMTKYGFFSIVCAHDEKGRPHKNLMMIRARKKEHLERIQKFDTKFAHITETGHTDYPYRIIADRDAVVLLVARLMDEVDYSNFKNAAKAEAEDPAYNIFLHTVWAAGTRMEPASPPVSWGFAARCPCRIPFDPTSETENVCTAKAGVAPQCTWPRDCPEAYTPLEVLRDDEEV